MHASAHGAVMTCALQVFAALRDKPHRLLRSRLDDRGRLFSVGFAGEDGSDHGGLYRDVMQRMVEELFSANLDLFLLSPNGVHQRGVNRDKFLPSPLRNSPRDIEVRAPHAHPCSEHATHKHTWRVAADV